MPSAARRIAILGLFNSGSTVLAGMLHRLGVNLAPPFFHNPQNLDENYFESRQLAHQLRQWWAEPLGVERVSAAFRSGFLKSWATLQERSNPAPLAVKHPLLAFSAADLVSAWGNNTCFIRAMRPLDESIDGLRRRAWFPGHEVQLQKKLWNTLADFERSHRVATFDWNSVKSNPLLTARDLAMTVGLSPTEDQLNAAAAVFRPPAAQPLAA
ncbi:MAG TPA: hypothetical protein VMD30_10680 [Tepidisphaeraceae bacterium]|nr:hypothetical protein [Tepidisphaeraceae bacterium]